MGPAEQGSKHGKRKDVFLSGGLMGIGGLASADFGLLGSRV